MPKKETLKIDRDELIEALTDGRVVEAYTAHLMVSLKAALDDAVREHLKMFEKSFRETMQKEVSELVDTQMKTYEDSMTELMSENAQLKERLEQLEIYSRADNLTIHGIPEKSAAEVVSGQGASDGESLVDSNLATCDLVVELCNKRLGVAVARQDISTAHRLRSGKKEGHRPIVVRFTSRRVRDEVYRARRNLRQSLGSSNHSHKTAPVFINEQLTKTNAEIFFRARKLLRCKQITGAWTNNGEIFIKKTSSVNEKPSKIRSIHDLPKDD